MYLFLWLFGRSILPQELPLEQQPRGGQAGAAVRLVPGGRGGAHAALHGISAPAVTLKNGVTVMGFNPESRDEEEGGGALHSVFNVFLNVWPACHLLL